MKGPVLVTGGAGFIGRALVRRLIAQGYETHVLDPAAEPGTQAEGAVLHRASILDRAALEAALAGKATVFHLAAKATLWARDRSVYERINHHGTRAVLAACARAGVARLVVTSTALVLRDWRRRYGEAVREDTPAPPLAGMPGPYARSKWRAERAVREAIGQGLPASLVYPTMPIGPPEGAVTEPTEMLKSFLTRPPPAYLETRLDLVDVEDVAEAHILAAEQGEPGGRYLLAGESLAFSAMLQQLEALSGQRMPHRRIPYALAALTARIGEHAAQVTGRPPAASLEGVRSAKYAPAFDAAATRAALGWRPRSAEKALARAVAAIAADSFVC